MRLTTSIALALSIFGGTVSAQSIGDAAAGESIFKKCAGCHQAGDGARNRVGPVLTNVLGRVAGTFPDYRYGKDMVAAGAAGLIWTPELIVDYLENPRTFLRTFLDDNSARAKMSFRLRDEQDRLDVVAYLGTFQTSALETDGNICVSNNAEETYFFAVDNGAATAAGRLTAELAPGESLCTVAALDESGFVSVFETAQALEGCSRLVSAGNTEGLVRYADFDRCEWTSHSG